MPETRHKAVLEIRAETRGIKEVGKEMDRAFNPQRIEQMDAQMKKFSRDVEALSSGLKEVVTELQDAVKALKASGGQGGGGGGGGGGGTTPPGTPPPGTPPGPPGTPPGPRTPPPSRGDRMMAAAGGYMMGRGAATYNYAQNLAGAAASGGGLAETAFNGIPIVGGFMAGAMGTARRYVGMSRAYSQAQTSAYGSTGRGVGSLQDNGVKLGLDPSAMAGMLGQIGQSTGLRGDELTDDMAGNLATYQRVLGIDGGGVIGANTSAGGSSSFEAVEEAVGAAIESGFREGRISEYLAEIAGFTESARRQGISLTTDSANALTRGMSGLGLSGEAASGAGLGAAESLRRAGDNNSYLSRVAAQVGMGEMGLSYTRARAAAEGDMAPGMLSSVMQRMWADSGGNVDVMAELLFTEGLAPSRQAALRMAENFEMQAGGEGGAGAATAAFSSSAESRAQGRDAAGGLMESRRPGFSAVSGGARRLAGMQAADIGVGGEMEGLVSAVENIERTLAHGSLRLVAPAIAQIASLAQQAITLISAGDWAGLATLFTNLVTGALGMEQPKTGGEGGVAPKTGGGSSEASTATPGSGAGRGRRRGAGGGAGRRRGPAPNVSVGDVTVGPTADAAGALQYHLQQAAEAAGALGAHEEGDVSPSYA